MKVSLKLEDNLQNQTQNQNPIHFKAKIPITVFSLPFLSAFSATHNHHSAAVKLSLSLRTHFLSGPSLKLSYNTPTTATAGAATTNTTAPLTLTLKSGVSFSGSPNNSPLIISANFSFSPQNANLNPSFTLQLKPRLGSFSLRKSVSSVVVSDSKKISNVATDGNENGYGFVPLDRGINWKDLSVESATKDSILSGVLMCADTELPVSRRVKVNLRWGVNIPADFEKQLPYLRVNKIKIERIDVKEEVKKEGSENGAGEFEMLKGMYAWMSRELSELRDENREMRRALEDVKSRPVLRRQDGYNNGGGGGGGGKRGVPATVVENSDGFEQWRMKKNGGGGEANGMKEIKKNGGSVDMESELQRAIKAASSS